MSNSKFVQICEPTVSSLYYVLGNLRSRWETIGKKLNIPDYTLQAIKNDFDMGYRQLSEVFKCWLQKRNRNWLTIVNVLKDMNQVKLAKKVHMYTHFDPEIESHKPHWLMRNFKEICEPITNLPKIVQDLHCTLATRRWYEIGCLLKLDETNVLHNIAETKNRCDSDRLMTMMTALEKNRCTWRDLIFVLKELDLDKAAHKIEKFAEQLGIPKAHIDFEPELRRAEFVPDDEQGNLQKISISLNPSQDDIAIGSLYEHLQAKELNDDERRKVAEQCTIVVQVVLGRAGDTKETIKECKEEMEVLKNIEKDLVITRTRLMVKHEDLVNEKKRIIKELKHWFHPKKIKQLKHKLKEVTDNIDKVCNELEECEKQLETIKQNYAKIKEKFENCMKNLNDCKGKLAGIQSDANKWHDGDKLRILFVWGRTVIGIITGAVATAAGTLIGGIPGAVVGCASGALIGCGIGMIIPALFPQRQHIINDLCLIIRLTTRGIEDASKTIDEISKIISDMNANCDLTL